MRAISTRWPDNLFTLHTIGEDDESCSHYYRNGQGYSDTVTAPEFHPSLLR